MDESHRWDLWSAAYLANGGCSGDGRNRWPSWGGLEVPVRLECEDLTAVAYWAYEAVTGQEPPLPPRPPEPEDPVRRGPAGEDGDFGDLGEMRRRYPRLWAVVREQRV